MDTRSILQTPGAPAQRGSFHVPATARRSVIGLLAGALILGPAGGVAGADPAFPATLTDDEGTLVTIEAPPQRIVSLSPANTEIVYALDAGARLVGGTDADDYPPEAAALPDVVTSTVVLMERVVDLEPDLVLAAGSGFTPPADIARMRELGIPVLVVYAESVEEVLADIELIGEAVGEPEAAADLTGAMRLDLAEVATAVAATDARPRTFYEIGAEPEIYAPAPESFVADLIELAGGEPITTGDPLLWSIALEELLVADPEVIVLGDAAYGVCPEQVVSREGWSGMTAVREGAIRPVDDIVVTRPGPRLPSGLASLARAIHPEIDLSGLPSDPPICSAAGS